MRQYCLKITSKNQKSLKKILVFFVKYLKTRFHIIKKLTTVSNKKKVITLLKSPHINKTAQEHFEFRTFSKQLTVSSFYLERSLIFLKKTLTKLFPDVAIKLEFTANNKKSNTAQYKLFYPKNFKLFKNELTYKNIKRKKQKLKIKDEESQKTLLNKFSSFLNLISLFGENIILTLYPDL